MPATTKLSKNNLFKLENVKFEYPNGILLSVNDLEINVGDCILITGISGSGKSTFLHLLKGLMPDFIPGKVSGKIWFKQEELSSLSTIKKVDIALLWQNPEAQFINSNVYAELAMPLENLGFEEAVIHDKISHYAKKFQIEDLLDKKILELSSGQKQKINLIALLLTDPEIILLDEPTAFLDSESTISLVKILCEIAHKVAFVIIEHNLSHLHDLINRHLSVTKSGELLELSLDTINWSTFYQNIEYDNKNKNHREDNVKPILQIKYYERQAYYKITNFNVYQGEIIGIIGKNGIGKSTWLKKIAKLDKIDKCSVYYNSIDITTLSQKKYFEDIALLLQNSEHHFLYNSVATELQNNHLLFKVGLNDKLTQNPFTLSEGQKRRLAIAIMWDLDRKLYFLDEPTFGQDYDNKVLLRDMILEMNQLKKTFIIISHDLSFLYATCNKIFEFTNDGLILRDC